MTDNELLLAISEIADKKIEPIQNNIKDLRAEQTRINLIIENDINERIKLLAENYIPAAKRYERATDELEAIKSDVDLLKKVITEHTAKLQKIS